MLCSRARARYELVLVVHAETRRSGERVEVHYTCNCLLNLAEARGTRRTATAKTLGMRG